MHRRLFQPVCLVVAALVVVPVAWTATAAGAVGSTERAGDVPVVGLVATPAGQSPAGEAVTLVATVTQEDEARPGYVRFLDTFRGERTDLGIVVLEDGVATVSAPGLLPGGHVFEAHHAGDAGLNLAPAFSAAVPHDVLPAVSCPEEATGPRAIVRLVYMKLLGRCPDPTGFSYWVRRLEGGASPVDFARSIASTPEALSRVVDDAYRTMLGRPSDRPGRLYWTGRLQRSGRYDHLLAELGSSREFWTLAGGTDEGFVVRVYDRLLRRAPDPPGREHWIGRLAGGTSPRALVLMVANQDEVLGRLATQSFYEFLDRAPAPNERFNVTWYLRTTGDRSGIYAYLVGILAGAGVAL